MFGGVAIPVMAGGTLCKYCKQRSDFFLLAIFLLNWRKILPFASFVDAVPWAAKISAGVVPAAGQYFAMQTFHWNVRNAVINDATNDAS